MDTECAMANPRLKKALESRNTLPEPYRLIQVFDSRRIPSGICINAVFNNSTDYLCFEKLWSISTVSEQLLNELVCRILTETYPFVFLDSYVYRCSFNLDRLASLEVPL